MDGVLYLPGDEISRVVKNSHDFFLFLHVSDSNTHSAYS